ncbi:hypothetical protein BSPLISOX_2765 [uncultured Gammaproteobacteria bacterium]|jgi:uncharacterized membrane protein HdeD (DUF308 family)|nr:hypothetical protein BSPLISOX_2765 [uncultured Gammaproteobacteria bacterium]
MEHLLSFLNNLQPILRLIFVLANTLGIFFIVRGIFSLTTNKNPRSKGDFIRMILIGVLLTAFANIIDIVATTFVGESISPKGEMQRYIQQAANKSSEQWKEAIISAAFAILILIGTWGILKGLVKLSSASSQRQEKDLKVIMSIVFSALLINLKWVLSIIEATFSFKFLFL